MGSTTESLETFFQEYKPRVIGYFSKRGCNQDESEDLMQTTFKTAHRHWTRVEEGKEEAWLFRVADRVFLHHYRENHTLKRDQAEVSIDSGGFAGSPIPIHEQTPQNQHDQLVTKEYRKLLNQAIENLPKQQQRCLKMRHNGMTYTEIADALNLMEGTVKATIHGAEKTIKQKLRNR